MDGRTLLKGRFNWTDVILRLAKLCSLDTMPPKAEIDWDASGVFLSCVPFRLGFSQIPVENCVPGSKLRRAGVAGMFYFAR